MTLDREHNSLLYKLRVAPYPGDTTSELPNICFFLNVHQENSIYHVILEPSFYFFLLCGPEIILALLVQSLISLETLGTHLQTMELLQTLGSQSPRYYWR